MEMEAPWLLSTSSDLPIGYIVHLANNQLLGTGTVLGAWVTEGTNVNTFQGAHVQRAAQQDARGKFTTSK